MKVNKPIRGIAICAAVLLVAGAGPVPGGEPKLRDTLHGGKYRVTHVAFGPDGKALLSSGTDRAAVLWDELKP